MIRDIREVRSAGICFTIRAGRSTRPCYRDDVHISRRAFGAMCNESFRDSRERILMKNIAYAGALVAFLDIDMAIVEELLEGAICE